MKTKIVKIAVVTEIIDDSNHSSKPYFEYDLVLVHIDKAESPAGRSDYYVNLCKATSKAVHHQKTLEHQGCKIFSRFVDYEVMRISDVIYMSDLQEDGFLDKKGNAI